MRQLANWWPCFDAGTIDAEAREEAAAKLDVPEERVKILGRWDTDTREAGEYRMTIKTYPEMDVKIVELLQWDTSNPLLLYAARRIEELEVEVEQLRGGLEAVLDEATSDHDRDIIITECQSALTR